MVQKAPCCGAAIFITCCEIQGDKMEPNAETVSGLSPGINLKDNTITFDYVKSHACRVVHADGVHGGLGPRNNFYLSFFNERWPIPQSTIHKLIDGKVSDEFERITRQAVVREVEVSVEMSVQTAQALHKWLTVQLMEIQKLKKIAEDVKTPEA